MILENISILYKSFLNNFLHSLYLLFNKIIKISCARQIIKISCVLHILQNRILIAYDMQSFKTLEISYL